MENQSLIPRRHPTRAIRLGPYFIGGGHPVRVQSMTNTDTRDVAATVAQIDALVRAGCEIVRLAVLDEAAARAIAEIKSLPPAPLIADIHFDHRLALLALASGIAGLRLNPGNIGGVRAGAPAPEGAEPSWSTSTGGRSARRGTPGRTGEQ